jgi:hypothetical protein
LLISQQAPSFIVGDFIVLEMWRYKIGITLSSLNKEITAQIHRLISRYETISELPSSASDAELTNYCEITLFCSSAFMG